MRGMRGSALPRPGMLLFSNFRTSNSIPLSQILILAHLVASQGGLHLGYRVQIQVLREDHLDHYNRRVPTGSLV